jgi:hypothetical protein
VRRDEVTPIGRCRARMWKNTVYEALDDYPPVSASSGEENRKLREK